MENTVLKKYHNNSTATTQTFDLIQEGVSPVLHVIKRLIRTRVTYTALFTRVFTCACVHNIGQGFSIVQITISEGQHCTMECLLSSKPRFPCSKPKCPRNFFRGNINVAEIFINGTAKYSAQKLVDVIYTHLVILQKPNIRPCLIGRSLKNRYRKHSHPIFCLHVNN